MFNMIAVGIRRNILDSIKEKFFCDTFINSSIAERMYFELCSSKKRSKALDRLCHNIDKITHTASIKKVLDKSMPDEIITELRKITKAETVYCIGYFQLDGVNTDIVRAVNEGLMSGMGFAVFTDDGAACICEEQVIGSRKSMIIQGMKKREV